MALTIEQTENLKRLIRADLELRFKVSHKKKTQTSPSPEVLQKKKEQLMEILENQMFVSSISMGIEAPSKVADFKDRGFHDKMSLF